MKTGTLNPDGSLTQQAMITIRDIPHDDPLAYAHGFQQGYWGKPIDQAPEGDSLAPAYIKGYNHGRRVAEGEPKPDWFETI